MTYNGEDVTVDTRHVNGQALLYPRELFERLTLSPWNPHRVRDQIRAIANDVQHAIRGPGQLWSTDSKALAWTPDPSTTLYEGAAGTIFALDVLRARGLADVHLDLSRLAEDALELFRSRPDFGELEVPLPQPRNAALLTGETGLLLLCWRLRPDTAIADALYKHVRANTANKAEDMMWGTPGTLTAAALMVDWTGDDRWRDAWHLAAAELLGRRDSDGLWTQRLYGQEFRGLGSIHGAAGNVHALARLLEPSACSVLKRETAAMLARTAVLEAGLANWPHAESSGPPMSLHWCSGAPGILACSADYLEEELLFAGAELVWEAGAAVSGLGPGICCGTAGNGYALLKVFERTGDERWLHRACRFAVHALEQVDRDRRGEVGGYSLWKGAPGVALFAADCLNGTSAYPFFDEPL